jgi:outer membrane protein OmpA-like peptidoglycan-associated protein
MRNSFALKTKPCRCGGCAKCAGRAKRDNEFAEQAEYDLALDELEAADPELAGETWQGEANRNSRDYVRWVQQSLNQIMGLRLAVDGVMGAATRSAIRSFQQRNGLPADGVVGSRTEQALLAAGARPISGTRPIVRPVTICEGPPTHVIDKFRFDQSALRHDRERNHFAQIAAIAKQIVGNWLASRPVHRVCLEGHTDEKGPLEYNFNLGRRRAEAVKRQLQKAIRVESARTGQPDLSARIRFDLDSSGEEDPVADNRTLEGRELNRRVDVTVVRTPQTIPPDYDTCGVPSSVPQTEIDFVFEIQELEGASQTQRVRPRLCLYQNASDRRHRNHFNCQATRWARRIGAFATPHASNCRRRVGSTPYDTGADIIRTIDAAHRCLNRRIEIIHIFSHSGSHGIFGTVSGGTVGVYNGTLDRRSRGNGGRTVADIPTSPLSENVIFVFHGCNTAAGNDNFARALYRHLSRSRQNPKVYGHYNGGCAGRDNSWREYSRRSPDGRRRLRSLSPVYSGNGCCG